MRTENSYSEDHGFAAPPGHILGEIIDQRRLSDGDVVVLCAKLDISARDLCRLLVGSLALDAKLAHRLGAWCNVPGEWWLKREAEYRARRQTAIERSRGLAECGIV